MSIQEHLDTVETSSGSNFIALLKQRIDAGDQILKSHLENGNRNSTYTSSSIQNEIIELIHEHVLSSILCRLVPTTLYSIIVDGTTDSSNIEQLCFLIRYVNQHSLEIREDFLAFIPTISSTGEAIADHILSCLKKFGLPLTNCIGQAYDGAPCMSGIFNGCQAIIKRFCLDAEYMHCSSHALNLALIDSSSSHFIRNMFGIVKSIITFFNDSPKRSNALKYEIERPDNDYLVLSKKKRLLSLVSRNVFGKYVVGLKKFVERQMVEKFLSKNFRRHSTSSTKHFVEKYFVDKIFVDKTFRRHGISSTQHFVDRSLHR